MTAIIPINDKYRIELDKYCWAVCYWKPRSSHPEGGTWEGKSWHRTLQQAGEHLVKLSVCEDELEGIDQILNALSDASRLIASAIQESGIADSWLDAKNQFSE
jgi:hypothetical protein